MQKRFAFIVFLLAVFISHASTPPLKIRVACIGDSITFGAGIEDRQLKSYPAQLQGLLGTTWDVRNFGVSGATLLKNGDKPYWDQPAYRNALAFDPDIVIIKLGTNDSKPQNWKYQQEFYHDYTEMIRSFKQLTSKPTVYICLPAPAFDIRWGINNEVISTKQQQIIRRIAVDQDVQLIDLYTPFIGQEAEFPDKVHPNAAGAGRMARSIYNHIKWS